MADREQMEQRPKSPLLAAILSAFFPGTGFIYLGMIARGVTYMIAIAALIVAVVNISEYNAREMEIVMLGLTLGGVYLFQIFDSFKMASKTTGIRKRTEESAKAKAETPSMFGSILILVIGVLFQLNNLDMLDFDQIVSLWPLVLIGLGIHIMISNQSARKGGDQ